MCLLIISHQAQHSQMLKWEMKLHSYIWAGRGLRNCYCPGLSMAQAQGKSNDDQGEMKKEPLSFSAKSAMEKRNLSTGGAWSSQDTCLG